MAAMASSPDIRHLRAQKLAESPFPGGRNQELRIFLDPAVHAEIWKHGSQDTSVEICGVLVGRLASDAAGPWLHVSASIRGEAASNKFAEVTFTHETWNRINQEMDSKFADRTIVGWYHTHPNFGIFLSDRDQFICQHFFSGPGQVAHVVDPLRKQEGIFLWRDGKTKLAPYFWAGDRLCLPPAEAGDDRPEAMPAADGAVVMAEPIPAANWIYQASLVLMAFLLGFLLHHWFAGAASEQEQQYAAARALFQHGLRPGLGQVTDELDRELVLLKSALDTASADHLLREGAKDEEAVSIAWKSAGERLGQARRLVGIVKDNYALSPDEERMLRMLVDAQRQRQPAEKEAGSDPKEKSKEPTKQEAAKKPDAPETTTKEPARKAKSEK